MRSTVSDTWSTDVLASDSEATDQTTLERLEEVAEEMVRHNLLGGPLAEARAFLPSNVQHPLLFSSCVHV